MVAIKFSIFSLDGKELKKEKKFTREKKKKSKTKFPFMFRVEEK